MSVIEKKFTNELSKGCEVVNTSIKVVGVFKHMKSVLAFAKGSEQVLSFESERQSSFSNEAIAVYGSFSQRSFIFSSSSKKVQLGYLPKGIAKELVGKSLMTSTRPLLTYIKGSSDSCTVEFDIVSPH